MKSRILKLIAPSKSSTCNILSVVALGARVWLLAAVGVGALMLVSCAGPANTGVMQTPLVESPQPSPKKQLGPDAKPADETGGSAGAPSTGGGGDSPIGKQGTAYKFALNVGILDLEISDAGKAYTIVNRGDLDMANLTVTVFPPPLTGTILWREYSFERRYCGGFGRGAKLALVKAELTNSNGASLSDSKRVVGVILVTAKIQGKTTAGFFERSGDLWIQSALDKEWSGLEPFIGNAVKPIDEDLRVALFKGPGVPYFVFENKELAPVEGFSVRWYPPPKVDKDSRKVLSQDLEHEYISSKPFAVNESEPVPFEELRDKGCIGLSVTAGQTGVLFVRGTVAGHSKKVFITLAKD